MFTTKIGTPIRRAKLHRESWKPLLRRAGACDVGFHDLGHTCATLLLTKGVHPKIVSEMLGHSSVAISLDIYSYVIPELGEVAANAMEDVLGDDPGVGGEETQRPLADRISDRVMRASGQYDRRDFWGSAHSDPRYSPDRRTPSVR